MVAPHVCQFVPLMALTPMDPARTQAFKDTWINDQRSIGHHRRHLSPGYRRPNEVRYGYLQPALAA